MMMLHLFRGFFRRQMYNKKPELPSDSGSFSAFIFSGPFFHRIFFHAVA
jgi:hypothetical protein